MPAVPQVRAGLREQYRRPQPWELGDAAFPLFAVPAKKAASGGVNGDVIASFLGEDKLTQVASGDQIRIGQLKATPPGPQLLQFARGSVGLGADRLGRRTADDRFRGV